MLTTCVVSGNEDALKVLVQREEALTNADSKGWIPLHEAAVQHKRSILEITYAGPRDSIKYLWRLISPEKKSELRERYWVYNSQLRGKKGKIAVCGRTKKLQLPIFIFHSVAEKKWI